MTKTLMLMLSFVILTAACSKGGDAPKVDASASDALPAEAAPQKAEKFGPPSLDPRASIGILKKAKAAAALAGQNEATFDSELSKGN